MGVLTLFVSALITGGVGPWLPYQMITAGWIGLFGPLARLPVRLARAEGTRWEVLWLGLVGGVWGFAYGMLTNLWFWPYAVGLGGQQWEAGLSMWALLRRYGAFYAATLAGMGCHSGRGHRYPDRTPGTADFTGPAAL